ncbi:MAG TPA: helix-turn-helix domain-containing protein [Solirubrobacteraceae bacterium]|jgi:AcrR family transcriptional regulator|nr:helix-turn-helix domain-containing protein [Solirubrobacteraceae bacterium]
MEAGPGLRERKKQKTRDTIIRVALELFAERGYEGTTIAEIAEAAEVSPRTIFSYFPSKEDILFYDMTETQDRLARALSERPEGATTLDVLRGFIIGTLTRDHAHRMRHCIISDDEGLQRSKRARFAPLERLVVASIAQDLQAGPDDIRPQIVAAALMAAFAAVSDDDEAPSEAYSQEHALAVIEDVLSFLRGGLQALRER